CHDIFYLPTKLRLCVLFPLSIVFFFFHAPTTTDIYTLSLHDALPISLTGGSRAPSVSRRAHAHADLHRRERQVPRQAPEDPHERDRKSTRLNSSHVAISYAVFCLKKKKISRKRRPTRFDRTYRPSSSR